ncbi:MAG: 3-methyl-2-oxobutanoate dehydrogenase subunit VorB [Thermodesulfobacteriota bacterium]|nr:3-methyl-2-oxobutanoate dehydrogenase subunit VorB [Thermodesulfobacteriota bacterium]
MVEKKFVEGNEAACWGAVTAGCRHFFGYPITPQNEVPEWFARELPRLGGVFVQSESELASIAMLYGAGATGVRVMTSTSSMGWSLMLEGLSHAATAEIPMVIMLVQRGGPGQGSVQHAQMDYLSATRGGHGGYKIIVLAPAYNQELCDLTQLAFYLADKYRTPVVVLSDGLIGRVGESIEICPIDFGPLPTKDWALRGKASRDGVRAELIAHRPFIAFLDVLEQLRGKWQKIADDEVRYHSYQIDDAEIVLVAYGYTGRVCRDTVDMARAQGYKLGLFRPISLWPFPYQAINALTEHVSTFVVVEDSNMGGLIEDVKLAVEGKAEVFMVGVSARDDRTTGGTINPDRVLKEIEQLRSRR